MAKVKFGCSAGRSIQGKCVETLDTVNDLGLAEGEWEGWDEDQKFGFAQDWANERIEIWYEEIV